MKFIIKSAPNISRIITFFFLLNIFISADALYHPVDGDTDNAEKKEQKNEHPKKLKNRGFFDWVFGAPGLLIDLPLKLFFKGIGNTIDYIDKTKLIDRTTDLLTSEDGLRAVRPTYSSKGGAGFKLYQKNIMNEGSKLEIMISAGLRSRQQYQLTFKRLKLFNENIYSTVKAGYRLQPDESFFGIGPNTHKDDRSNFAHEQVYASAVFGMKLKSFLDFFATFNLDSNNILDGKNKKLPSTYDIYSPPTLPGLENEVRIAGATLSMNIDSRESPVSTKTGQEILLAGGFFNQLDGSNYAFWKFSADLKTYIHLFHDRILLLRLAGEVTDPMSGKSVPFYRLSEMGRRETVRGFHRGRFRNFDMAFGSVEYRYPVWNLRGNKLLSLLFIDAGQVARDIIKDINIDNVQMGFGGGFLLNNNDSELLRLMIGKSKEQFRFYLVLN